jgi:hypothetical protein
MDFKIAGIDSKYSSLCWGLWDKTWKYGNRIINIKILLDDIKPGKVWWMEPMTSGVIEFSGQSFVIEGTFRHKDCKRVSSNGFPFENFRCISCSSIPLEGDFRMRLVRMRNLPNERGSRTTGNGRRLEYLTNSELMNVSRSSRQLVRETKLDLWYTKSKLAVLMVRVRSLRECCTESLERGDLKNFCRNIIETYNNENFEGKEA